MRTIDADALLERWCSEVCKAKPRCDEDCMFYDYLTIDSLSPTIEPEPHWIPCSERLPEEKGEYIVAYHPCYWDDVEAEVKVGVDSFRGKTSWAKQKYQRVIAWMPLPPVYQEEDSK